MKGTLGYTYGLIPDPISQCQVTFNLSYAQKYRKEND